MGYKNKTEAAAYHKAWRIRNRKTCLKKARTFWKWQREYVLRHYSKDKLECKCCGEKHYEFLALDHIHGGGTQHRKQLKSRYIYSYLIKDGFPKGYQVLCHNCNMAKAFYKRCPHRAERRK